MPSSPSDLSPSAPSRPSWVARLTEWLRHFWPAPLGIDGKERLRFVVGAVIGVLLTAWLSRWWAQGNGTGPWMVASLGASAVLVGRPQMHALAVAGMLGVAHMLYLLRAEFELAMAQTGCQSIENIEKNLLTTYQM